MAIINQKENYELFKLYEELGLARNNLASWAKIVNDLVVKIKVLENFDKDSDAAEKRFINDIDAMALSVKDNIPVKPDIVQSPK